MNTTISIPKTTKAKAQKVAKKYDMTVSAVAKMLLNDFASGRIQITTFISPEKTPNTQTTQVFAETDRGNDLNKVNNSAELTQKISH